MVTPAWGLIELILDKIASFLSNIQRGAVSIIDIGNSLINKKNWGFNSIKNYKFYVSNQWIKIR